MKITSCVAMQRNAFATVSVRELRTRSIFMARSNVRDHAKTVLSQRLSLACSDRIAFGKIGLFRSVRS